MDGWPRIPNPSGGSGKTSPRTTSTSLPAPGSTVVANVEDDLGEGMYSLRWAGQKINVSSRTPLRKGQALLLKSETSPEGKPRLVVLGPAPEQAQVTGRVIYGNLGKKQQAEQRQQQHQQSGQSTQSQSQHAPDTALSRTRVSGHLVDTDSRAGQSPNAAAGQAGGQLAAGVSKANAIQAPEPMTSLIGLVLEPVADIEVTARLLLDAAEQEKKRLQGEEEDGEKKVGDEEEEQPEEAGETEDASESEQAKKERPQPARPAVPAPPGRSGAAAPPPQQPSGAGQTQAPSAGSSAPAQPGQTSSDAAHQSSSSAPPASRPAAPVVMEDGGPVVPDSPQAQPKTREAPAQPQPPQPRPPSAEGSQPPPSPPENAAAPPVSSSSPPPQQQPASPQPAAIPGVAVVQPPAAPPNQPAAVPGEAAVPTPPPAPDQPSAKPSPSVPVDAVIRPPTTVPNQSAAPPPVAAPDAVAVQPPTTAPSQPAAQPPAAVPGEVAVQPPAAPDVVPVQPPPVPTPNQPAAQPPVAAPGDAAIQPPPTPGEPSTQPAAPAPAPSPPPTVAADASPQPPTTLPGQPSAPPAPETPVHENAGPVVPDVPEDNAAPRPPESQPPAREPAGTPSPSPDAAAAPQLPSPRPEASSPPPHGIYPRPGTATYSRPTPQQSHAAASQPSPQIKPEMLLKEALGQMVGAAEIPLGNPETDGQRLGVGNKMPEAVLDKAAAILLRGAGLSPDPETMEAAKALVANNVPVDRDSVQALLSAAAGVEGGAEREATLRAAARLLAKDIPLSPPLVSGLTDVISRRATAHQLMDSAIQALTPDESLPEAEPLMSGARELLDMLHVDLSRADAPQALERYMSSFGREALGQALAMIETSAQALLENNPQLQKIDQALTAILTQLQPEMEAEAPAAPPVAPSSPPPEEPPAAPTRPQPLPEPTVEAEAPSPEPQPQPPQSPPTPRPGQPINAYLKAPKAVNIEEMLKNLPPMPKVVSLGTTPAAILPAQIPALAGLQPPAPQPPPQIPVQPPLPQPQPQPSQPQPPPSAIPAQPDADATDPAQIFRPSENEAAPTDAARPENALQRPAGSGVLNKLDSLFQTPGLNRPELELLRPGGFLDRFLNSAADRPDAAQVKVEAEKLLRELMSDDPRTADRARRELPQKDAAVLRETASRLTKMESDVVRAEPLMNRLSDAATSLRDLGRQLLAVKAENLAGQDRNPGVMLAEVPFRLNDDSGDGRMQMFYRRGKSKGDGWSSRVILDLNTTRMGPVLGDMRFFNQDMILNMFVDEQRTADYLSAAGDDLARALEEKGFRVKMKFMVLPPPPPPPTLDAERPEITGEAPAARTDSGAPAASVPGKRGRLDIEM